MPKIIGVDLGTTNSVVAVMEAGKAKVIPSAEGSPLIPSVVAVNKSGERLVGQLAKRQAVMNPKNTIFSIKRLIGRRYDDLEVEKAKKFLPYEITKADSGIKVKMGDKEYSPAEISSQILQKLKTDAEAYLGEKVEAAVITVPAYFNDSQRQATKDAGQIAGFEVKRIINEPTASSLAYGLDKKKEGKIAVYDFGGGTFDITILEIGEGVFEVKSTAGDTYLGGDDLDQQVIDWLVEEFKKEEGIDLKADHVALQRLKEAAEKAKVELSTAMESEINLPFLTAESSGPKHLVKKLSRAKLEDLTSDLIEKTIPICEQAIKDAKIKKEEINEVILVGGQTRMPLIVETVKKIFGREPSKGVNPDEVVALGAAIQAAVLGGEVKDVVLLDVTPLSLGIETLGSVFTKLIERNTTIPTSKTQVFSTAADNQTQVEIHVLQGERAMAVDNRTLGRFILDGIPPAPRGVPQIEVSYDIDANGILNVKAKDKATGKEQKITITASSGLSKEEVERMQKEAEVHAAEDKVKQELAEAKNVADSLVYTAEKALKDAGDKVKPEERREIEDKILKLKNELNSKEVAKIRAATQELSDAIQKIGQAMYGQASGANGSGGTAQQDQKSPPKTDSPQSENPEDQKGDKEDKKS